MIRKAYCCLGKTGDLLSALPIVHHDFEQSGIKPILITSRQYCSVLERVDYLEPDIFEGQWSDLTGAMLYAKRKYRQVVTVMTYGEKVPIQHRHPSFQHDMYDRAGLLSQWDKLPLILSRREPSEERALLKQLGKGRTHFVLFADKSQSSPFEQAEELGRRLENFLMTNAAYPIQLVRLSQIKLDNFVDFLPLYDAALAIITIETAHLHLSRATQTPVLALVADKPQVWHGSAWSRRFQFHCRYRDYPRRAGELIRTLDRIINKQPKMDIRPAETLYDYGYNPSIIHHNNRVIGTYRYHPEKGKWRTELAGHDGENSFKIIMPDAINKNEYSVEDGKLFIHMGKLHLAYVVSLYPSQQLRSIMAYGPLVQEGNDWKVTEHIQPQHPDNNFGSLQKNWCFFEHDNSLYSIYGSNPEQNIFLLSGNRVVSEIKSPAPKWEYGEIRGGVVVPYKDNFLRFFHSRTGDPQQHFQFCYHIGALIMEAKPPFKVLKVGSYPIISGNERYVPGLSHWKPNVAFVGGVIAAKDGWMVSYGDNDCACMVAKITESDLNL